MISFSSKTNTLKKKSILFSLGSRRTMDPSKFQCPFMLAVGTVQYSPPLACPMNSINAGYLISAYRNSEDLRKKEFMTSNNVGT